MTTLNTYSPEEQADMVGMWCEVTAESGGGLVILTNTDFKTVSTYNPTTRSMEGYLHRNITPRDDLPRAWTPNGQPAQTAN